MDVQRYVEVLEKGDAPNAIVPLIIAGARQEALREAEAAIIRSIPHNCELNADGTEDARMAAWVRGGRDAVFEVRALAEGV